MCFIQGYLTYKNQERMKVKIDYYIRRKSDDKLMQICHAEVSEEDILAAARQYFTAPIHLSVGDDENDEYYFSDEHIVQTIID